MIFKLFTQNDEYVAESLPRYAGENPKLMTCLGFRQKNNQIEKGNDGKAVENLA